jgi:hypothetical protein
MAIVKAPALSLEASGNLGGINYTRWRGRAVARSAWIPTIPNTPLQQGIQSLFQTAVVNWIGVITQTQRELWNEYAKTQTTVDRLGQVRKPSGYNLYVGRQVQAFRAGMGILFEPPVDIIEGTVRRIIAQGAGPGNVRWRITGFVSSWRPDWRDYWIAGPYDSEARQAISSEWRFHQIWPGTTFALKIGVSDKWYWVRGRYLQDDGRTGHWIQGQVQAPT